MPSHFRTALAATAAVALTGGLLTLTAGPAGAATAKAPGRADADFNGDGYADVAISSSHATVSGHKNAGAVAVLYGGRSGNRTTTYTQNSSGVPGGAEADDYFGADTAFGDFNSDGYDDLVVGVPGEDVGSDKDGGTAAILWGSTSGLKGGTTLKDPRPTKHDNYGAPLEAGDFNGDKRDDIAVGTTSGAATIDILRGGFSSTKGGGAGTYTVVPAVWSGAGAGIKNLHSGDVNADGREDLIVNGYAKTDDLDANYWLPGSASGATTKGAQKLPAGFITDIGNTDKDGYADIVTGLEWDSGVGHAHKGGTALIIHGTKNGPASGTIQTFTQDTAGVPGAGEKNDYFGSELDLGDVNGDGKLDLIVGAPGETVGGKTGTGAVTVLFNKADGSGITGTGSLFLSQNTAGVPNEDEADDGFGSEVHIDDLNGDKKGDLVIAAPWENGNGAVYPLLTQSNGKSFKGSAGVYVSTVGISTAGTPVFGHNMAD
ncbi:FG-GAP-like repeat-containing protein [Streptomyces sp. NPDC047046]|uniref:FG-GAP-like repeat-containing protein n=1 Tax=Streptomyces sp. NPDC047046 TaxID=3155378 RepID=UPI0033CBE5D7